MTTWLRWVLASLGLGLISLCLFGVMGSLVERYPVVTILNGAGSPIFIRIGTAAGLDPLFREEGFEGVGPNRKARFSTGWLVDSRLILIVGGCKHLYPNMEKYLEDGYGGQTTIQVGPDLRLYRHAKGMRGVEALDDLAGVQPVGWPMAPMSRTCPSRG